MPNHLRMELINAIATLRKQGRSKRAIARTLNIDRQTVRRYLRALEASPPPSPALPASDPIENHPLSTAGDLTPVENHPLSTAGICGPEKPLELSEAAPGRPGKCDPYAGLIRASLERGLTAQRIYQDLRQEAGFAGSYEAVKRFARKLKASDRVPVHRVEVQPGEEVQVDFGVGAPLLLPTGQRKKTHVLRMVLSYSRKAYSEAVLRQDAESFIRALENGFRHFGGVPKILNLDNLKAGVLQADWYDPALNPKLESFCRHYGIAILPCLPKHPEHKGKTESSVKYVKNNALKARVFSGLAAQNAFLADWERTVADRRIHGTTRQQVGALFLKEKPVLQPLPPDLFPCFSEAKRIAHRDAYVEVAKAYYHVPPEHIGRTLWTRWDTRLVRIFTERWDPVITHARLQPGQFTKVLGLGGGAGSLEKNLSYWLKRSGELGQACAEWAQGLVERKGPIAIRSLMGLAALTEQHSCKAINQACAIALSRGIWRLRDLRQLLQQAHPSIQTQFAFASRHPIVRGLAEYGIFIQTQNPQT